MAYHYPALNPDKALIWRIMHRDNVRWVLNNGLHCGKSACRDPNFIPIGNPELISKRATHPVLLPPGGCLSDYVPFYFTPFSPMLLNIKSGRGGTPRRSNDEIVILVSSLHHVAKLGLQFLFTDSHAYGSVANYYGDLARLDQIDWKSLQAREFRRDPEDPKKFERYQAEALIYRQLPVEGLLGIMCYTDAVKQSIDVQIEALSLQLPIYVRPNWYFP